MRIIEITKTNKNKVLSILISMLAIFMHQSKLTNVGNISVSDILLIILIFNYIFKTKAIKFTAKHLLIYFLIIYLLFVSVFYTPIVYNVPINVQSVTIEIFKIIFLFIFFQLGSTLDSSHKIDRVIQVYSWSALVIGLIGIIITLGNVDKLDNLMFKYGNRLNGFMNDPNYFSVLQITALPYFLRKKEKRVYRLIRTIIVLTIILSIILSGSKTGFITLTIYMGFYYTDTLLLMRGKRVVKDQMTDIFKLLLILIAITIFIWNIDYIINFINYLFPSTIRVTKLFTDLNSAISSDGSSRSLAWKNGVDLIKLSPVTGIGIGSHSRITKMLFGTSVSSHNTYIQLAVEWGLPISILFFLILWLRIIKVTFQKNKNMLVSVQRDIVLIFMLGSMGITLNNARFFWLILGAFFEKKNNYKKSI